MRTGCKRMVSNCQSTDALDDFDLGSLNDLDFGGMEDIWSWDSLGMELPLEA